jgi:hypothetical protein
MSEGMATRDTAHAEAFIREFDEYEKHFADSNPNLRPAEADVNAKNPRGRTVRAPPAAWTFANVDRAPAQA